MTATQPAGFASVHSETSHTELAEVLIDLTSIMADIWIDKRFWCEFIDLYKQHPCLWNIKSKEYSNRNMKSEAYDVLVKKLREKEESATRDTVTKKINNMRSSFRKEVKKVENSKKSGSATDEIYCPSLWYYEQLLFLRDQEKPLASSSNIEEVSKPIHI